MPGFVSHYLFGQETYKQLRPSHLKHSIQHYHRVYALGLQGPDVFFYNIFFLLRKKENPGSVIHEKKTREFFSYLLKSPAIFMTKQEQDIAKTYIYGFIGHFLLDTTCHPYVYARSHYNDLKDNPAYFGKHIYLESDIDTKLLWHFQKKHPSEFHQSETIAITKNSVEIISSVLHYTISHTFPQLKLSRKEISFSIHCMQRGTKLLYDQHGHKKRIVRSLESLYPGYPMVSPMIQNDTLCFFKDPCNEKHISWSNPWQPSSVSQKDFYELFAEAKKKYARLLNQVSDFFSTTHTPAEKQIALTLLCDALGNGNYHCGFSLEE